VIEKIKMTAREVTELLHGEILSGRADVEIESITTDSRETGEKSLFVPLVGESFDGHNFIEKLIKDKKISASLTMKGMPEGLENNDVPVISCDDTLRALGRFGLHRRKGFDGKVYGVTGTNGKTTTKELVHKVLSLKYNTHKSEKNYNNEIGVPFALMALREDHDAAVFEMGMNHTGEIERLTEMVRPDVAIITNAGAGHLEFLGTVENVARAKSEILKSMDEGKLLIVNRDTECFDIIEKEARDRKIKIKTVGMEEAADVSPESYELTEDSVSVKYEGKDFTVPVYGRHNIYNILFAIAVAEVEGISMDLVMEALCEFGGVSGRSEILGSTYKVINDTYNSNPLSSEMALLSVSEVFKGRKKVAVLSDMKELGEASADCHYRTGKFAGELDFDLLCFYGDMAFQYRSGALSSGISEERVKLFPDKDELSDFLLKNLRGDEIVLVKGSRSMKMEDVVKRITGGNV